MGPLRFASSIIGSHDDREGQYNLTIDTADQDGGAAVFYRLVHGAPGRSSGRASVSLFQRRPP